MKLVFLTVSLIAAFTVDCRSQPEPDSLHSDIAEELQWPDSEDNDSEDTTSMPTLPHVVPDMDLGPDDTEDDDPEQRNLWTEPTPLMPDFTPGDDDFDIEEEEEQSENELRGSCGKAKLPCSIAGGKCITSGTPCYGRLVSDGCKGNNCYCCIPGCSKEQGFFSLTGSAQCFKFLLDQPRNWTKSKEACRTQGLALAHPSNSVALRSYLVETFGNYYAWLDARGDGSYFRWQNINKTVITSSNPLWYTGQPGSKVSTSYALLMLSNEGYWKNGLGDPYYSDPISYRAYALCELKME